MQDLAPDDAREIAGYRLQARLGEGGMGVVYLSHTRGGQPVAVSKIRDDSLLKANTGICIASSEGAVTHLWIKRINKEPENDNLSTYVLTATQWKPE
ncbi:hypothetical protein [Streptomyces vastus]|uniref:Protein kinase domain-containing protein n=1 Tax=Streptomyces vastus TaxID=285451 RepID=A0ABN3QZM5_9ACTN